MNNRIDNLHDQAMELSDQAFIARRRRDYNIANDLFKRAFELEYTAAEQLRNDLFAEPTRSVLYRSAASLAMDCGDLRAAERLIATALSGNPPEEIADELRDLLEQVYFQRHVGVRGVIIEENDLHMSIVGRAIGFGVALSDDVIGRIDGMHKLLNRTIERLRGRPYRESGSVDRRTKEFPVLISAPRPGSFAVTFSIGTTEQSSFFNQFNSINVINDVVSNLKLLNDRDTQMLSSQIQSPPYFENFLELAALIAPTGDDVSSINITTTTSNRVPQGLEFQITRREISETLRQWIARNRGETITIRGKIRLVDSIREGAASRIILIDDNKIRHRIIARREIIDKVISTLWTSNVEIKGKYTEDGSISLESIKKVRN